MKYCDNCGTEINPQWRKCPNCGNTILPIQKQPRIVIQAPSPPTIIVQQKDNTAIGIILGCILCPVSFCILTFILIAIALA